MVASSFDEAVTYQRYKTICPINMALFREVKQMLCAFLITTNEFCSLIVAPKSIPHCCCNTAIIQFSSYSKTKTCWLKRLNKGADIIEISNGLTKRI